MGNLLSCITSKKCAPERTSTQLPDSLWFDYCTTDDMDARVDPDIKRVDKTTLHIQHYISTLLWDHNEVRTEQINAGSNTNKLPHPNGPYGTHQDCTQQGTDCEESYATECQVASETEHQGPQEILNLQSLLDDTNRADARGEAHEASSLRGESPWRRTHNSSSM